MFDLAFSFTSLSRRFSSSSTIEKYPLANAMTNPIPKPASVIRNTNFRPNGNLSYENIALLDVESKELAKRELLHGDIILEKSGGGAKTPVGRVCLFEKQSSKIPYSLSNFTSLIRVKDSSILNYKYLHNS